MKSICIGYCGSEETLDVQIPSLDGKLKFNHTSIILLDLGFWTCQKPSDNQGKKKCRELPDDWYLNFQSGHSTHGGALHFNGENQPHLRCLKKLHICRHARAIWSWTPHVEFSFPWLSYENILIYGQRDMNNGPPYEGSQFPKQILGIVAREDPKLAWSLNKELGFIPHRIFLYSYLCL